MALDLLDQLAFWAARAVPVLPQFEAAAEAAEKADHRLARSCAYPRVNDTDPDCARAGGSGSRVVEERGARPFAVGFLCVVGLIVRGDEAPEPIIPLRLFANRIFAVASLISFAMSMVMIAMIILLPLDFELGAGMTP